jgi:hypothetical protein
MPPRCHQAIEIFPSILPVFARCRIVAVKGQIERRRGSFPSLIASNSQLQQRLDAMPLNDIGL